MATFSADRSFLSGFLKPNQDMANLTSLELARGLSKVPAYAPFIVPRIDDAPWPVATNGHASAIRKWRNNTRQAKHELLPNAVPIQAWLLYQMRFYSRLNSWWVYPLLAEWLPVSAISRSH